MDMPQVRKRISNFLSGEEGKISKQSLITMGAFLSGAAIGSMVAMHDVQAKCTTCEKGCDLKPADGQAYDPTALEKHNAYEDDGTQKFFGTAKCSDDDSSFHFNGTDFSYANGVVTAQHHHHGSHNSY
jgi:hypothetical protein